MREGELEAKKRKGASRGAPKTKASVAANGYVRFTRFRLQERPKLGSTRIKVVDVDRRERSKQQDSLSLREAPSRRTPKAFGVTPERLLVAFPQTYPVNSSVMTCSRIHATAMVVTLAWLMAVMTSQATTLTRGLSPKLNSPQLPQCGSLSRT